MKKPPATSFTEREFQLYEETGLKRRNKLISHTMNSKYKFYVIPYVHDEEELKKWLICYNFKDENATVKIIDPAQLIEEQKKDKGMKYHYLLEDLDEQGRPSLRIDHCSYKTGDL